MGNLFRGRLGGWLLVLTAAATAPVVRADAVAAVQVLRAGGCGGILPAARPLRRSTLLDSAAAGWAAGQALESATGHSGYGSGSIAGLHVSGSNDAIFQLIRRSGCPTVMDPGLRDIGVYQWGSEAWIVLAPETLRASPTSPATPAAPDRLPAWSASPSLSAAARPSAAAPAYATTPSVAPRALESRALELVNDVRARGARCGARQFAPAPALALSGTLSGVASGHANEMAEHNYFEHQDLAGLSPADRVRAVGYREKLVGENIAYGPESIEEVVKGWLDSPGHCENLMDPRFVEMGIAYATGRVTRRGLYWVQVLAEPRA
jgi:uncharacterized protein YkwD